MITIKKYMALLLAAALIVLSVPLGVFTVTAASGDLVEIWDGTLITSTVEFSGGDGSANYPYIITNGAQLAYAIDAPANAGGRGGMIGNGRYFKLANDIYLNDVSDPRWYENEDNNEWLNADGNWAANFQGYLDGDGHCVYGIWYSADGQVNANNLDYADAGLVPRFQMGEIKNIGVRYSQVYAYTNAGAIVGRSVGGNAKAINQCFSDETVRVKYTSSRNGGAGGILGKANSYGDLTTSVAITNCYSKANVNSINGNNANGIIGASDGNWIMQNCYSVGFAPNYANSANNFTKLYTAGMSQEELAKIYNNVYTDDRKTRSEGYEHFTYIEDTASMKGEAAKTNMPGLDYDEIFETVENGTPKLRVFKNLSGADVDVPYEVWDGSMITGIPGFSSGSGKVDDPYIIKTGAQLAYAIDHVKGMCGGTQYFKLANDIYLNDVSDPNWYENEDNNPWLNADGQWGWGFRGHIDGDGHCVYGIWYPETAQSAEGINANFGHGAGLIPVFFEGTIQNIGVRYAQIYAKHDAGAIAGTVMQNFPRAIKQCFADETVNIAFTDAETKNEYGGAGGIVGFARQGNNDTNTLTVSNCYSKATVSGSNANRTNGIVGYAWESRWSIQNSYSVGLAPYYASRENEFSYLTGAAEAFQNIYNDVREPNYVNEEQTQTFEYFEYVESDSMKGEAAKKGMPGLDYDSIFAIVENDTPQLQVFGELPEVSLPKADLPDNSNEEIEIWDGSYISSTLEFSGGNGSAEYPYIITNGAQLAYALELDSTKLGNGAQVMGNAGQHFKLANDIYLNDVSDPDWYKNEDGKNNAWLNADGEWRTGVRGYLDGDGYCVYGIWYPEDAQSDSTVANYPSVGLVPVYLEGVIQNIGVRESRICGKDNAGAIVGITMHVSWKKEINNCFADETVFVKNDAINADGGAAGILGRVASSNVTAISNCYSKAIIEGKNTNGIIGTSYESAWTMENCYSIGFKPYNASGEVKQFSSLYSSEGMKPEDICKNVYTDAIAPKTDGFDTGADTGFENFIYIEDAESMKGASAKDTMNGLDFENVYYWTTENQPALRLFGERIHDITGDSICNASDLVALRKHLIGAEECGLADINGDSLEDIRDLIRLKKILM